MANLKSIIIKQLCSKFKVPYFLNLCLLLSLSSCTSEDLDEVIGIAIFVGVIWIIIFPMAVVYFILFLVHVLRFLYYTHKSNQKIEGNSLDSESMDKVVSITEAHQVKKWNLPVVIYFIGGLVPLFIFSIFLIIASWEYGQSVLILTVGVFGILFAIFVFHLGGAYMVLITGNSPPRLIVEEMTKELKPKDLLSRLETDKAFSSYRVKAIKNELILYPKKFSFGRLIVIQCISKKEEKYIYKVEASVRPINNIGFEMNQGIIDRIINLENK